MHVLVWEFEARPGSESAFESVYGPAGDWVRLFGRDTGYRGSELIRDVGQPGRYVVIDRWVSEAACRAFRSATAAEYESLDRQCQALTLRETLVGAFERVHAAPRSPAS